MSAIKKVSANPFVVSWAGGEIMGKARKGEEGWIGGEIEKEW